MKLVAILSCSGPNPSIGGVVCGGRDTSEGEEPEETNQNNLHDLPARAGRESSGDSSNLREVRV